MKTPLVYLSGPITGVPKFKQMFQEFEEAIISACGCLVINPAKHQDGLTYEHYMELSMVHVRHCDELIMLPCYYGSRGAQAELYYALSLGKTIRYEGQLDRFKKLYDVWNDYIRCETYHQKRVKEL